MSVLLSDACPLMREAFALGQEAGAVYAVLWEAAWHDRRGDCGGTTQMSHKSLAALCHMSNTTVMKAIDALLDDGLISCLGLVKGETGGSKKRIYRVIHPSHVEAQRAAIAVMGEALSPSKRARALRAG